MKDLNSLMQQAQAMQQKMQELHFAPNQEVWAQVQARIQKKKRRRPVVLWFLLAGLMVGGSWIVYSTGVMTPVVKKQAVAKPLLKKSAPAKTTFTQAPKAQHTPVASLASKTPATKKAARLRVTGIAMENKTAEKQGNKKSNHSRQQEHPPADINAVTEIPEPATHHPPSKRRSNNKRHQ